MVVPRPEEEILAELRAEQARDRVRAQEQAGWRRGGLSASGLSVPLEPFWPGAAHVVQLRPIAMHETAENSPNERQDMHSPLPRHVPGVLTGLDLGLLKGGCEAVI